MLNDTISMSKYMHVSQDMASPRQLLHGSSGPKDIISP